MDTHNPPQGSLQFFGNPAGAQQGFSIQINHDIATADFNDLDLESLLSVESYPDCLPTGLDPQKFDQAFAFGFQTENAPLSTEWHAAIPTEPHLDPSGVARRNARKQTQAPLSSLSSSQVNDDETAASPTQEGKREKRRRQVRLAQRTYRARKASVVTSLAKRTFQLESALSDMASTVVKLRDVLRDSNASLQHPELASLAFASERSLSQFGQLSIGSSSYTGLFDQTQARAQYASPVATSSAWSDPLPEPGLKETQESGSFIGYSAFIERFRISVVYFAYRAVIGNVHTPGCISRPLWLLSTVMNRDRMAAFFAASIHATIMRVDIGREWDDVPIFRLGGRAGSQVSAQSSSLHRQSSRWRQVRVPLEALPADMRSQYEGDWLDADQLEEHLKSRGVRLYSPSSTTDARKVSVSDSSAVHTARLIAELLEVSVCLGRTPGFKVCDVDIAIDRAMFHE